jgi:hypothetical protein
MTPHAEASVVSMTPLNTVRERRPSPLNESARAAELLQLAHFIEAKVASHRDIVAQSKHVATSAKEDLERHQQWLERHRMLALQSLKQHQRRRRRRRAIWVCRQTATVLILLLPLVGAAWFQGMIGSDIYPRDLLAALGHWF